MPVKRSIAIVGATEEAGIEIASDFACEHYRLLLVSNDLVRLSQLQKNIFRKHPKAEIDVIECMKDGCWEADIIILAVPSYEEKIAAGMMKEVATQKIVVRLSSQENEDVAFQQILPNSKLVRVSDILASKEIVIAGSDQEANEEVAGIFQNAGFHITIADTLLRHKRI